MTQPNGPAPEGDRFHIGARGGRTGQAWQHVWDHLDRTEYRDGIELAREAAAAFGLKEISVSAHLRLAVREGWLQTENRWVDVTYVKAGKEITGRRLRTFYRIGSRA